MRHLIRFFNGWFLEINNFRFPYFLMIVVALNLLVALVSCAQWKAWLGRPNSLLVACFLMVVNSCKRKHRLGGKITYNFVNWALYQINREWTRLLFASILNATHYPITENNWKSFANSLLGLVIGHLLGVCECAAPIADGMHRSGGRFRKPR